MERFPATIELALSPMLISSILGVILGIISATRQYSWFDYMSMVGSLMGVSMPVFWLGLVLMLVFSLTLGWFPMSGRLGAEIDLPIVTNFYVIDALLAWDGEALKDVLLALLDRGLAREGDRVIVTAGVPFDVPGTTNLMKVETI